MQHPESEVEVLSQEQLIEAFYNAVGIKQSELDSCNPELVTGENRQAIIDYLDSMCPFNGEEVDVYGFGGIPIFDEEGDFTGSEFLDRDEIYNGTHLGVAIVGGMPAGPGLQICHQVMLGQAIEMIDATCIRHEKYYGFFDMNASVTRTQDIEEILVSTPGEADEHDIKNPPQTTDVLGHYEKAANSLIQSTKFRRLSRSRQVADVEQLISEANVNLQLQNREMELMTEYAYAQIVLSQSHELLHLDVDEKLIAGQCLGVISLDSLVLREKPIRRDSDRPDILAGLCLVIDPDEESRHDLQIEPRQTLFVPTKQGLAFSIVG